MHLGFKVYYSKDYFSLPTNKDDFGAEARGPFKRGACDGRPICQPQTPALIIDWQ